VIQKPTGTLPLTFVSLTLLVLGMAFVVYRASVGQTGLGYYQLQVKGASVEKQSVEPRTISIRETEIRIARSALRAELPDGSDLAAFDVETQRLLDGVRNGMFFSWQRTIGIWIGAFMTLAVLSFLWRDNPAYRVSESVFVGVSAAYWMVIAFYSAVTQNLVARLFPSFAKATLSPYTPLDETVEDLAQKNWLGQWGLIDYESAVGTAQTAHWAQLMNFWYWIPFVLGILLLWRLMPKGQWVSRYTIAFVIGSIAGIRLVGFLSADFVTQIKAAIDSIYVPQYTFDETTGQMVFDYGLTFYESFMKRFVLLAGTLCVLVYFFFSLEHKGVVGQVSRVGIWVLMVTFGAGFGYTVMGRIALLVGRFEFLVKDWLAYTPVS
jgi:hypothetical protein